MRLSLLAVAALCVSSLAAHADTFNYNVSAQGATFGGSGTLTTSTTNGVTTITGISGPGVTGLIPVNGFYGNDNLLYPANNASLVYGYLDVSGFSFTDVMGTVAYNVNVYSSGGSGYMIYLQDNSGLAQTLAANFTVNTASSVTPEPSSFALLGTGLLGMAGVLRKRFA